MSSLFIDVGYISYKWGMADTKWELLERLIRMDPVFCYDSNYNLRMATYPWYKSNRGDALPQATKDLGVVAHAWQQEIKQRYPQLCVEVHGLEGDDIVAMQIANCPQAYIMSQDHDFLQLNCAYLIDQHFEQWSVSRIKQKTLWLQQGERYIAYQLLMGCRTDTVPRSIFSKDRYTAPWCFSQPSPLRAALMLIPEETARQSLDCLLIPTPLYEGLDSIEVALNRYPEK